jgi:DNA-binding transcriptional regulator GbsR (MarR family)
MSEMSVSSMGSLGAGRVRRSVSTTGRETVATATNTAAGGDWRRSFVDDFCELDLVPGTSRATMRVLGWMVVCQPTVQSAQQIMSELRLSAGSVSGAVNALHDDGLLERLMRSGDRHVYYRLRPQGWEEVLEARFRNLGEVRRTAERALRASRDEADPRLRALRDIYGRVELGVAQLLRRAGAVQATRAGRAWSAFTPHRREG